ncbi:MAG: LPS export ABC transporter periplasmic protein LptC [Rectinemataceae bacterium]|jgi:LPS export ABC transporter protein LptC
MPRAERRRSGRDGRRAAASVTAVAVAATFFAACSLAGYTAQAPEREEEYPVAVFSGYSHTVVVRGKRNFELKADKAELYETSKKTILSGVSFSEYDTDTGELLSLGRADDAIYHTDTKDAEFFGNVRLESKRQDAVLQGEYLRWIDKDKRLEGRLDGTVTISRADGSQVSGAGFDADTRKRTFAFRESVEGRIESKEEPDSTEEPK